MIPQRWQLECLRSRKAGEELDVLAERLSGLPGETVSLLAARHSVRRGCNARARVCVSATAWHLLVGMKSRHQAGRGKPVGRHPPCGRPRSGRRRCTRPHTGRDTGGRQPSALGGRGTLFLSSVGPLTTPRRPAPLRPELPSAPLTACQHAPPPPRARARRVSQQRALSRHPCRSRLHFGLRWST